MTNEEAIQACLDELAAANDRQHAANRALVVLVRLLHESGTIDREAFAHVLRAVDLGDETKALRDAVEWIATAVTCDDDRPILTVVGGTDCTE